MTVYLVWSNEAGSWWGPGGRAYTGDVWKAGRYTEEEAQRACRMRSWRVGTPPPEVMVGAPENTQESFTPEELAELPVLMRKRIDHATSVARVVRMAMLEQGSVDAETGRKARAVA